MTKIGDIVLKKKIGKGSFAEVFLSKKEGRNEYFATKKLDRKYADDPKRKKYFDNEINILRLLHHPNIVKLEEIKASKDYYYIVMEYANGGSLSHCLKKYQEKYNKSFSEEIVQFLMRQIVDAIKYIHAVKIIHRDLKLDNIMVSFDNEIDKNNLNMLKAKIKIIDFGLAIQLPKSGLTTTALGSPINMDPFILNKFRKSKGSNMNNKGGYNEKIDIWSLGTVCYEMLIGKVVFEANSMDDLIKKVEAGNYSLPTSISKEVVSFINAMLQYDSTNRYSAEELSYHPFLKKRVFEFTKIDTKKVSKKIDSKGLNINVKKNNTIWAIFNEDDEAKLININDKENKIKPIKQHKYLDVYQRNMTEKPINKMKYKDSYINNDYYKQNTYNNSEQYDFISPSSGTSFYGESMNKNSNIKNQGIQHRNEIQNTGMPNQTINNYSTLGPQIQYPYNNVYNNNYLHNTKNSQSETIINNNTVYQDQYGPMNNGYNNNNNNSNCLIQ